MANVGAGVQVFASGLVAASVAWSLVGPYASSDSADLQLLRLPAGTTWILWGGAFISIAFSAALSSSLVAWPSLVSAGVLGLLIGIGLRAASGLTNDANIGGALAILCIPPLGLGLFVLSAVTAILHAKGQ